MGFISLAAHSGGLFFTKKYLPFIILLAFRNYAKRNKCNIFVKEKTEHQNVNAKYRTIR